MKTLLLTVSGPDQPGITSKLMQVIHEAGDSLSDIGQAVTHGLLSLSFVITCKDDSVLKELFYHADQMGLSLTHQEISSPKRVENNNDKDKYILNCVSNDSITAKFVGEIANCLAGHDVNIHRIDNMRPNHFKAIEILTTMPKNLMTKTIKEELLLISNQHAVDIALLKDNVFRRSKRLIVFDMDSTLIQTEVIDEMADVLGVGPEVRAVTEKAMNGEMNYDESLKMRVSKLKGLTKTQMKEILDRLPLTPGVEEFVRTVQNLGYKLALISGGFSFFADALKERLSLDYAFANDLEMDGDVLTGKVEGTIVNPEQKSMLLKVIAQQEKISLDQVVAIGDGANDLPMLATAGLGIAFHAKDIVKEKAQNHMSHGPMTTILYFLGIPEANEEL
jgi:phosphoserine phosphatase